MRYVFRDPPFGVPNIRGADPQQVGDALEAIKRAQADRLRPADVVAAATPPEHVLHRHFEWDDAVAGAAFRIEQARNLIQVVRALDSEASIPRIAWLSIGGFDSGEDRAYVSREQVISSRRLQMRVLDQAIRDLQAWERRYAELADICSDVRRVGEIRERLRTSREAMSEAPQPMA